jgi:hypothetical protein
MQSGGGASEGLDQGKLNPRQAVGATKVSLDIGNEAIEQPRSIAAPVNLVPGQLCCLVARCFRWDLGLLGYEPRAKGVLLPTISMGLLSYHARRKVRERAPLPDADYMAFVDPSGGSADSMTLAIGHKEGDIVVIDALRERKPPFSPDAVVDEFAALLASYEITKVSGDKYAGMWPRERFEARNVTYEPAETPKSDLYRDSPRAGGEV